MEGFADRELQELYDSFEEVEVPEIPERSISALEVSREYPDLSARTESDDERRDTWNSVTQISFVEAYDQVFKLLRSREDAPNFAEKLSRLEDRIYTAIHDAFLMRETRTSVTDPPKEKLRDVVKETPPVGSAFTRQGGYVTPGRAHIPRELRMKVWASRAEFAAKDPTVNPSARVDPLEFDYIGGQIKFAPSSSKN